MKRVLLILLAAAATWAQGADPYVGYIYPCGIQAGTTNRLLVGGQAFPWKGCNAVVSGQGVELVGEPYIKQGGRSIPAFEIVISPLRHRQLHRIHSISA